MHGRLLSLSRRATGDSVWQAVPEVLARGTTSCSTQCRRDQGQDQGAQEMQC